MLYHLTMKSENSKTGPMPVGGAGRLTCPPSCPLQDNGCYAEQGPLRLKWDKIDKGVIGRPFSEFVWLVENRIPLDAIWRYGEEGDLPGIGDGILPNLLEALVTANRGRRVLAYTHKPVLNNPWARSNRECIADAMKMGFNINLSGNNPEHADRLADLQLAPVVTVLPYAYGRRFSRKTRSWTETQAEFRNRLALLPSHTPGGRRIAVCPATYKDNTTCLTCQACTKPRAGGAIIGFPAHGSQAFKAEIATQTAGA